MMGLGWWGERGTDENAGGGPHYCSLQCLLQDPLGALDRPIRQGIKHQATLLRTLDPSGLELETSKAKLTVIGSELTNWCSQNRTQPGMSTSTFVRRRCRQMLLICILSTPGCQT